LSYAGTLGSINEPLAKNNEPPNPLYYYPTIGLVMYQSAAEIGFNSVDISYAH
jgi:hypothetical protein